MLENARKWVYIIYGYISAQKLESESSKSFAVSIPPRTKPHQEIVYSLRDMKISPKFREIEPKLVKIRMRVNESDRSKSFAVFISLQTKAIKS